MLEIALLVETSTSWGVDLVKGIGEYAQQKSDWLIDIVPRGKYESCRLADGQHCDGIITRITSDGSRDYFRSLNVPVVNVASYLHTSDNIRTCTTDDVTTGEMAADYYLSRGFRHFAYVPSSRPRIGYHDGMKQGYLDRLDRAGYTVADPLDEPAFDASAPWSVQRKGMTQWLRNRARPLAVFVWDDTRGRQITEACRLAGLRVPEDVAVLSTGADEVTNTLSDPPLSSIALDGRRCGRHAAEMLDRMINGRFPDAPALIRPSTVITQKSTDHYALQDELIASIVRHIHRHACEGLDVEHLVSRAKCSRRTLEIRFREALGVTPAQEIRRTQLEQARLLLEETGRSVAQIAKAVGYRSPEVFSKNFAQRFNESPRTYRKRLATSA